jgi:hypothetical protein
MMVEDGDSARAFGLITGVPTAFVVDTKGILRWKGNWAEDAERVLAGLLVDARLLPRIPEELADVRRLLERGMFPALAKRLDEIERGEPKEDAVQTVAAARSFVEGLGRDRIEASNESLVREAWYETWLSLDDVREKFDGFDAGLAAERLIRDLLSNTTRRDDVKAGRAFYDALARIDDMSPKKAAETLRRVLFSYRETRFFEMAEEYIERLGAE